ncbi:DUF488 domain-containing protein [Dyella sp. 2RAB6]|uniref:DUF488 domain-containing protein n=1 Tax=Dyella sp. 2RAB6 TaxID=3232992 RepID=UPI003F915C6C
MTIFTIGYEGLDIDSFIELLKKHGIETVVDIRELPLSRKPGFSKRSLSEALKTGGLAYVHMVALGCPRPVRDRYKHDGDWGHYTKGFLRYLDSQDEAIDELAGRATASNCALLCFEADYRFCHRSFVADAVQARSGATVRHITKAAAKTTRPARSARVAA